MNAATLEPVDSRRRLLVGWGVALVFLSLNGLDWSIHAMDSVPSHGIQFSSVCGIALLLVAALTLGWYAVSCFRFGILPRRSAAKSAAPEEPATAAHDLESVSPECTGDDLADVLAEPKALVSPKASVLQDSVPGPVADSSTLAAPLVSANSLEAEPDRRVHADPSEPESRRNPLVPWNLVEALGTYSEDDQSLMGTHDPSFVSVSAAVPACEVPAIRRELDLPIATLSEPLFDAEPPSEPLPAAPRPKVQFATLKSQVRPAASATTIPSAPRPQSSTSPVSVKRGIFQLNPTTPRDRSP